MRQTRVWIVVPCAACLIAAAILAMAPRRSEDPGEFCSAEAGIGGYGGLPLAFEPNRGQADPGVEFLAQGRGYTLFLTADGAILTLDSAQGRHGSGLQAGSRGNPATASSEKVLPSGRAVLRMRFLGALPEPEIRGAVSLPGRSNYLIGNSPAEWKTDIAHYGRVEYVGLYPGVDLVFRGEHGKLEYDFVVAPGADPRVIGLGLEGAEEVELDSENNLVMRWPGGEVVQRPPVVYQEVEGAKELVSGCFVLEGGSRVSFRVGEYDPDRPLVIDPVLSYSTYLGGSDNDGAADIAVDSFGNVYVVGDTSSTDFPTAGTPLQPSVLGNASAFVTKLNATGSALVYSTYLGGSGQDIGLGIALDAAGNALVTGQTGSTDFPTLNAAQGSHAGQVDVFVTKLNATGSAVLYSTYLGGSGSEWPGDIGLDSSFGAYVTGGTDSVDFPTLAAAQTDFGGGPLDAFVARLHANGSSLVYSTYLGGSGTESNIDNAIAVDPSSNAYVTGDTDSTDFPTTNAFQPVRAGVRDAFVAKLDATGSALYSTYLGGAGNDAGGGIASNLAGEAYLTGVTRSSDFPTMDALQAFKSGGDDAYVVRISASGSSLVYATFLGGISNDRGEAVDVDQFGRAYVVGSTLSTDFPTAKAVQGTHAGGTDAFVVALTPTGFALVYSTYLGGNANEFARSITADDSGDAYVAGTTLSTDFPTANPLQTANAGVQDGFIANLFAPYPLDFWIAAAQVLSGTPLAGDR